MHYTIIKGNFLDMETWLSEYNCHQLDVISDNFVVFHSSAVEDKLRSGILSGPHLGVQPSLFVNTLPTKSRLSRL